MLVVAQRTRMQSRCASSNVGQPYHHSREQGSNRNAFVTVNKMATTLSRLMQQDLTALLMF